MAGPTKARQFCQNPASWWGTATVLCTSSSEGWPTVALRSAPRSSAASARSGAESAILPFRAHPGANTYLILSRSVERLTGHAPQPYSFLSHRSSRAVGRSVRGAPFMKVLVLGSGGREHAIVWKLKQSLRVTKLYCAPGSGGIVSDAECVAVELKSLDSIVQLASRLNPDVTVVGPELPLTLGVVDEFRRRGWPIFGPTRAAAQLESSKSFAKEFMQRHRIPTAHYAICTKKEELKPALAHFHTPIVVKADGLAAGKGVVIAQTKDEALRAAEEMLAGKMLGEAGSRVVLEECLVGEELSFLVMSDGERVVPLVAAQDHKRVFDNDQGPNTGGMGAYSDSLILNDSQRGQIMDTIIEPVVRTTGFTGFLYAGLMMTADGPSVLEFNVRLGDPETQPLMMRLESDWGEVLLAAARGSLNMDRLDWSPDPATCVVLASGGYPGAFETGKIIQGIDAVEDAVVFHAGTRQE